LLLCKTTLNSRTIINLSVTEIDHTVTEIDHTVTEIDHTVTKIDHTVTEIDPTVTEIDHAVTEIDHTVTEMFILRLFQIKQCLTNYRQKRKIPVKEDARQFTHIIAY